MTVDDDAPLTVKEFIEKLKAFEPDQQVVVGCETDSYGFHPLSEYITPDLDKQGRHILIIRWQYGSPVEGVFND